MALKPHDQVPHFEAVELDGRPVHYRDFWQRRNLLLIALPEQPGAADDRYVAALDARRNELTAHETAMVITRAAIGGVPRPGVVIADRWGEVHWVASPARVEDLPRPADLIDWLRYVQMQCPECQGETR